MTCVACGRTIPQESVFCMYCGVRQPQPVAADSNRPRPELEVTALAVGFEGAPQPAKDSIKRTMGIYFQLTNSAGQTVALDGELRVALQMATLNSSQESSFSGSAKAADFYRANDGQLWYAYRQPVTLRPAQYGGKVELWFRPNGSRTELYKLNDISINPAQ